MNRFLLLACSALVAGSGIALADSPIVESYADFFKDGRLMAGVSPNGKYAYGYKGRTGYDILTSVFYNVETKTWEYATTYIADWEELDGCGQICDVNDNGTRVGTIRDKDWVPSRVTVQTSDGNEVEEEGVPIFGAALWDNNGTLKKLPRMAKYKDPDNFVAADGTAPYLSNGFFANAISNDEKYITGYVYFTVWNNPCYWVKNDETGEYDDPVFMTVPEDASMSEYVGASEDLNLIVWNTDYTDEAWSVIWRNKQFDRPEYFKPYVAGERLVNPHIIAVAPDGQTVMFECERGKFFDYGIYNLDTEEVQWIPRRSDFITARFTGGRAIANNGMGVISNWYNQIYYFDCNKGSIIPIMDYIDALGIDISKLEPIKQGQGWGMSGDGRVLVGNRLQYGLPFAGFVVRFPENRKDVYFVNGMEAIYTSPTTAKVRWQAVDLADDAKFKKYVVKSEALDGETQLTTSETKEITEPVVAADGTVECEIDATLGQTQNISVVCVFEDANGVDQESVPGKASLYCTPNTELFFFDNLDDATVNSTTYVYAGDNFTPLSSTENKVLRWSVEVADYNNTTPFWKGGSIAEVPWDSYLLSRWFDATDKKDFYLTYMIRNVMLNFCEFDESNTLAVEYTLDGENWNELSKADAVAINGKWNIFNIPLTELEGKVFRLRFHLAGEGNHDTYWYIDHIGIMDNDCLIDAPKDLLVTRNNDGGTTFTWKGPLDAYEVSHNYNSPRTYSYNVGNEGKPLQIAQDYDAKKLAPFAGKYITSVATLVYEPADKGQDYHTTVEAIVYDQNLNEISRGKMGSDIPFYDTTDEYRALNDFMVPCQHIYLDKPVLVEKGKTYRVAIRITNYEPNMMPLWYLNSTTDYIPGVTDLYSDEDDGKTWKAFSDIYAEADESIIQYKGCPIWNIRPCITDESTVTKKDYPQRQWYYIGFKNGEQMTNHGIAYFTQQTIRDVKPVKGSTNEYTVKAFLRNGWRSPESAPLTVKYSGVEDVVAENSYGLSFDKENNLITLAADCDKAAVYTVAGAKVAEFRNKQFKTNDLADGIYIVVVEKAGKSDSFKVAIVR